MRRFVNRGAIFVVVTGLLASACSDDDGSGGEGAAAWVAAAETACNEFREAAQAVLAPIFESESEPEGAAVLNVFTTMRPQLEQVRATIAGADASGDAAADRDAYVAALDVQLEAWEGATASEDAAMAQFQEQNGIFTSETGAVADASGAYACGTGETFQQDDFTDAQMEAAPVTEVKAIDYGFEAPGSLSAGDHVLRFSNGGGEDHEMILIKLADGTSYDDALAWATENADSDEEPDFMVGFWGGYAGPSGRTDVAASLTPGTYALICFLPAADEEPHFLKGMSKEVTVA